MDEAQEILLNSLGSLGVSLPPGVSSVQDLNPGTLVSICAQSLHLIDDSLSFPTSLPDIMAERFKICAEIASAIKGVGYRGDISFNQFLYPSEEDSYKLVRFLVERLSEASEGGKNANKKIDGVIRSENNKLEVVLKDTVEKDDNPRLHLNQLIVTTGLNDLKLETEVVETTCPVDKEFSVNGPIDACLAPRDKAEKGAVGISGEGSLESSKEARCRRLEDVKELIEESGNLKGASYGVRESPANSYTVFEQNLAFLQEHSSKIKDLHSEGKMLLEELSSRVLESQCLQYEYNVLEAVVGMATDHEKPIDLYVEDLNKRIEAGRNDLVELGSQWDALNKPLEDKKRSLEESLHAQTPEVLDKLKKLKEVELQTQEIISEIQKREEEHSRLSAELKDQPKVASRKSYIQRISEITKNSRKQDADIERILQETRELQIESNSIQDRLHRTYAVVDETIFRDAKKDSVSRQAYRLLTSLHQSFEQISEKILATDRARREIAEHEAKLAAMASRSLDINRLQTDLDAIRRENEFLEQRLHNREM
ncbi:PREDICTED: coiled-coil domain-containing protein 22 isoform X2 [Nelumbo nucifera]|uniref:Coiled-coil domain-containing protein 22 isoform X2 n=1 Tax=Nelumbo nucifera TaxID=4432 RepID=A0A1U7ZIP8_NELNU|nr:PREDICTED: coiled-coil domain-containing protein 22 isoform X2 [Nelumbo nucifera]